MASLIVVHASFEYNWPFVANTFLEHWQQQQETKLIRLGIDDTRTLGEVYPDGDNITRMAILNVPVTPSCLEGFPSLTEATVQANYRQNMVSEETLEILKAQNVTLYNHISEGFWGQSVSEMGLAMTLCGLRRIPQLHREMIETNAQWQRYRSIDGQPPESLGVQFCDDLAFTHGTIEGKRIRIVGAGNIASRYASFVNMLGADVAAYDPFATEAHFHRAGSRCEWHLDELVKDAQIFVPMIPLTESTRGLVTEAHINALPTGCLVVMVTRANICDMAAVRRRVLADELSLAADVFDVEPVPLDDPLLGRHNVVHTPHIAGRTMDANKQWAKVLLDQFRPQPYK